MAPSIRGREASGTVARFVFGTELADVSGTPAVLADHAWMWTEAGRAVAVPVEGRRVHGLVVDADGGSGERGDLTVVTVTTAGGEERRAEALVVAEAEPGPFDPARLADLAAAARHHGLPGEWCEQLAVWARRGADGWATPRPAADGPATLGELLARPGVTEQLELRSRFGFLAIHGGDLEAGTDEIARRAAAASGASYYGVVHPAGFPWHLASADYDPAHSGRLRRFLAHVRVAVSLHGYGRRGMWRTILLGGTNRALAATLARELRPRLAGYEVVADLARIPVELRGRHPANPVNGPPGAGVQVELPPRVRGLSPLSPPPGPDGLSPPTRAVVDALAAVAGPGRSGHRSRPVRQEWCPDG